MKKIYIILVTILFLFVALSCNIEQRDQAERNQQKATEQLMSQMDKTIGMPAIKNFQERKLAKMIFELRDQADLITYTYIVTLSGNKVFLGKSIGYGLPYSIQYTNPLKDHPRTWQFPIPQADPNGLYMPQGLSATWVMLINPKTGKPLPVYVENEIIVSPFPLH